MDTLEPLPYDEFILYSSIFLLLSLIVTIAYSVKRGGIKEVIENLFLWFLFFCGFAQISFPPVDAEDEMTAAIYFVAFGLCRVAKNIAKNAEAARY